MEFAKYFNRIRKVLTLNATTVSVGAVLGTLYLGYAYYAEKRRQREQEIQRMIRENAWKMHGPARATKYQAEIEAYFKIEVLIAGELISDGEISAGIAHVINALNLTAGPRRFLRSLQNALPARVFAQLMDTILVEAMRARMEVEQYGAGDNVSNCVAIAGYDKSVDIVDDADDDDICEVERSVSAALLNNTGEYGFHIRNRLFN